MNSPLADVLRSGLKRARGDAAIERSQRSVTREIEATNRRLREEIAGLSARLDAVAPKLAAKTSDTGPFAQADQTIRRLFDDPRPWLVPAAVDLITQHLSPEQTVLEYGGGSSTPYWCERVGVLHTVEASHGWGLILMDYMCKRLDLVDRWRLHFVGANWASVNTAKRRTGRSMPEEGVRRRMEDDYAVMITDRVDVVIVDGSVRQRTVARVADYLQRDQPSMIVVDNMEAEYVARPVQELDLSAYERHNFWGTQTDLEGTSSPECTTVWLRRTA